MIDRTNSFAAAEELLKRRSTRKSLVEWARYKGFEPAKHHELIISEIESFLAGDEGAVAVCSTGIGQEYLRVGSVAIVVFGQQSNPQHLSRDTLG